MFARFELVMTFASRSSVLERYQSRTVHSKLMQAQDTDGSADERQAVRVSVRIESAELSN